MKRRRSKVNGQSSSLAAEELLAKKRKLEDGDGTLEVDVH
jgi:hypothetical protein